MTSSALFVSDDSAAGASKMTSLSPLTLAQATTPSRAACDLSTPRSNKGKGKGSAKKGDDGDKGEMKFVSPPPKNASEQREWDRMSTRMNMFHNHFRHTFAHIWQLTERVTPESLPDFLDVAEEFVRHLEGHHGIEERYIFPVLAKKMPEFRDDHLEEHERIHEGMERYDNYLRAARQEPSAFKPEKMREIMASWGPILFYHLDAEVESLKADNLRRYYTLDETRRLPM